MAMRRFKVRQLKDSAGQTHRVVDGRRLPYPPAIGSPELEDSRRIIPAEWLKQARHYGGYTRDEVATAIGISPSTYRGIEAGKNRASLRGADIVYAIIGQWVWRDPPEPLADLITSAVGA
jgi:DNA-binding XRE family transcriptional regulator